MMQIDERKKRALRSLLQVASKDREGLAIHVYQMQQAYGELKDVVDILLPKIDDMLGKIESLRPIKGKDYFLTSEREDIIESTLSRMPKPEPIDEEDIIKKAIAAAKKTIKKPKDGAPGVNGMDGKDAEVDYDLIAQAIEDALPGFIEMPDYTPETGESILEKLANLDPEWIKETKLYLNRYFDQSQETFKTQQQIDNAVSTLRNQVSFLINKVENLAAGSSAVGGTLARELPVGDIDGVNTLFTVTNDTIILTWNGQVQNPLISPPDFTYDSNTKTITMAVAPMPGDNLLSYYQ